MDLNSPVTRIEPCPDPHIGQGGPQSYYRVSGHLYTETTLVPQFCRSLHTALGDLCGDLSIDLRTLQRWADSDEEEPMTDKQALAESPNDPVRGVSRIHAEADGY